MRPQTFNLPPQASTIAPEIDGLFYFIFWISVFFFFLVGIGTVYFAIRYRRKSAKNVLTADFSHSLPLELTWTIVPTILFFVIFFWGWHIYIRAKVIPGNALEVRVTAAQWSWNFQYENDGTDNQLVVPVGQPIKLRLESKDVIHSVYIPDFRVKWDALPNRYTSMWFTPTVEGEFDLLCTEFCGNAHSKMNTLVRVVSREKYDEYLESIIPREITDRPALFRKQACHTCHNVENYETLIGPSLKGVFGKEETLADGSTVLVDENYIRESILEPGAKVVAGFAPQMPSYQGRLNQYELEALIQYIKDLADEEQQ